MELKFHHVLLKDCVQPGSNRTFMELKYHWQDWWNIGGMKVLIVPLWN